MRHAMIMAGGSGTRLWPMSRARLPKQLIPFIHGKSLLEVAMDRLTGLVPPERCFICAGETHRQAILSALPKFSPDRYLGEPTGRDTLNAVGFGAAAIGKNDPDATIAVFTADHLIEPADVFQKTVERGYALAEKHADTLVTFGIEPTHAATGYGYLELGEPIDGGPAQRVSQFKEKPDAATAERYVAAGPRRYLWNSGMFVWRAATLLECIRRYEPANHEGLMKLRDAWGTPRASSVLQSVYPQLKKISIDYAVMEPASRDPKVRVAVVPMPVKWLDVGSWPAFGQTRDADAAGNAVAAERHIAIDSKRTLVASNDKGHLIATIGCEDLIVIHTPDATLVCRADQAERIKDLHKQVGEMFGEGML